MLCRKIRKKSSIDENAPLPAEDEGCVSDNAAVVETTANDCYEEDNALRLSVTRHVYTDAAFAHKYEEQHDADASVALLATLAVMWRALVVAAACPNGCWLPSRKAVRKCVENRLPAIRWLANYVPRQDLLPDLLAGITVGIMHIPQGMAYALLATVPPIYGLYSSFFPVLVYWIFGTSRQISIGTFAVVSLMVAGTLADLEAKYVPPIGFNQTLHNELRGNATGRDPAADFLSLNRERARILIVMANAFWVGVIHLVMFVFQLGWITSFLSEPFVNSFLAGASVHVFASQFKFLFHLKLTPHIGLFKIPKTFIELASKLPQIQPATLIISAICVLILGFFKICVNERFRASLPAPVPIELFVVVLGTLISYLSRLSDNFNVSVIGPIPAGLPGPEVPPLFLINDMLLRSVLTAIVAYAINFSLADIFCKMHRYKINATQELLAYGAANVFSSFFPCFATGASLARSCVQNNAGGRTQLVSIISSIIVGIVLLFIAPLFRDLPQACLAAIIVVALKPLLMQLTKLSYYWRLNKTEFFLFLVTFLGVVVLDVVEGLALGLLFYAFAHMFRSTQPCSATLGHIADTELYKDIQRYKCAREIDGLKIVRVQQELHATNANAFKRAVYECTGIKPHDYIALRNKIAARRAAFQLASRQRRLRTRHYDKVSDASESLLNKLLRVCVAWMRSLCSRSSKIISKSSFEQKTRVFVLQTSEQMKVTRELGGYDSTSAGLEPKSSIAAATAAAVSPSTSPPFGSNWRQVQHEVVELFEPDENFLTEYEKKEPCGAEHTETESQIDLSDVVKGENNNETDDEMRTATETFTQENLNAIALEETVLDDDVLTVRARRHTVDCSSSAQLSRLSACRRESADAANGANPDEEEKGDTNDDDEAFDEEDAKYKKMLTNATLLVAFLIIDCSPVNFIDSVGVKAINQLIVDYQEIGVDVYLAECNDAVRASFARMQLENDKDTSLLSNERMYVSVHDTVLHCLSLSKKKEQGDSKQYFVDRHDR